MRQMKMKRRVVRIRALTKEDRRCRVMVWTAARPQGTWGHQGLGLAPTSVRALRASFAAAALLRKTGGCTTTAYALTVGLEKDPSVSLRVELLST